MAKFRDSISEALNAPGIELFRKLIEDYERDNDVPMADIAAALALQSRDGEEFLMTEPPPEKRRERDEADRGPARTGRERKKHSTRSDLATYRIAVGKRHKVAPGAIVGAIANEGGLHRSDFGHISIKVDHSLVELPAKLPAEVLQGAGEHPHPGHPDQPATGSRQPASPGRKRLVTAATGRRAGRSGVRLGDRPRRCRSPGCVPSAALLVVLTHAAYTTGKYPQGYVGLVLSRAEIGVPIFFVLSGFLLFRPWVKAVPPDGVRAHRRCARYAWHRVRRIMPAYVGHRAGRLRALPLPAWPDPTRPHLGRVAAQPVADPDLHRQLRLLASCIRASTQMWSLAVEAAFYVALPVLAWLLLVVLCRRHWRPALLYLGLAGLFAVSPAWLMLVHTTDFLPDGARLWLPTYLAWFVGGMLLAVLAGDEVCGPTRWCASRWRWSVISSRRRPIAGGADHLAGAAE